MKNPSTKETAAIDRRIRKEWHYNRNEYINQIVHYLIRAAMDFYCARLAKKNGYTRFQDHWKKEAEETVKHSVVITMLHEIRGFKDRRQAAEEALGEAKTCYLRCRVGIENSFKKNYRFEIKRHLTERDSKAFWKLVDREVGEGLLMSLDDLD